MSGELKPEDLAFSEYPEPITGGMHAGLPKGVMAVHLPTGIKVVCNHERSQHMNRDACLRAISAALNTRHGAGDAERSAELTTAWMAGVERERERAARDAEDAARFAWWFGERDDSSVQLIDMHIESINGNQPSLDQWRAAIDAARAGERG